MQSQTYRPQQTCIVCIFVMAVLTQTPVPVVTTTSTIRYNIRLVSHYLNTNGNPTFTVFNIFIRSNNEVFMLNMKFVMDTISSQLV